MQNKRAFATIAAFMTALFAATLIMAVQSAFASDGFKNCSPRNPHVCAESGEGGTIATTTDPNLFGNSAFSGNVGSCVIKNGHAYGTGCA